MIQPRRGLTLVLLAGLLLALGSAAIACGQGAGASSTDADPSSSGSNSRTLQLPGGGRLQVTVERAAVETSSIDGPQLFVEYSLENVGSTVARDWARLCVSTVDEAGTVRRDVTVAELTRLEQLGAKDDFLELFSLQPGESTLASAEIPLPQGWQTGDPLPRIRWTPDSGEGTGSIEWDLPQ
jgi:hypothetical protein